MTLGAERGSLFIIDKENEELVADLFDEGIDNASGELHKKKLKFVLEKKEVLLVS